MKKLSNICLICLLAVISACTVTEPTSRLFEFRYLTHVTKIPDGAKELRLWIPLSQNDKYQEITNVMINCPYEYTITKEKKYGNTMIYVSVSNPPSEFDVEMSYNVRRFENSSKFGHHQDADLIGYGLQTCKMIPLSEEIRSTAAQIIAGKGTVTDKARAIYDHVLNYMTYDKSGTGWGHGDFNYAREARKGNCTDFHSYFIGLCRNADIPAYYEIGITIKKDPREGKTGGYCCWTYYHDGDQWVPVDAASAAKKPEKRDYFFGNHCENRVGFTKGRDLILEPSQSGEPVNYFIYPYAEVDGKRHNDVSKDSYYKDLSVAKE